MYVHLQYLPDNTKIFVIKTAALEDFFDSLKSPISILKKPSNTLFELRKKIDTSQAAVILSDCFYCYSLEIIHNNVVNRRFLLHVCPH